MSFFLISVSRNKIGWKFYLVLICPSFFYIITMYFIFPETKGRTLEEMETIFHSRAAFDNEAVRRKAIENLGGSDDHFTTVEEVPQKADRREIDP